MADLFYGDNQNLSQPNNRSQDCLNKFLQEIGDDVSGACMIPIELPRREVVNIANRAKKWFRKNYQFAVRTNLYLIPDSFFDTDHFKQSRTAYLPLPDHTPDGSGVYAVYEVADVGSQFSTGGSGLDKRFQSDGDFSLDKLLFEGSYMGGSGLVGASESMVYYTMSRQVLSQSNRIFNHPISYEFNFLTGELKFTGAKPKSSVVLKAYETIEDCALFEDEYFFRYVAGKVKQSIGTKASVFKQNLPGNVEFDYSAIKDMGKEEIDSVVEEIKGEEGMDFFFMQ